MSSPSPSRKRALPFVSPQRKQPKRTTTSSAGGLPVQELLEVFTQPEELEGSDLKAATVHGRKNPQAMVEWGRATTGVSTAVEMMDDSTTATAGGASTINTATGGPPTELQIPGATAPTMTLKPSQHPQSDKLIRISDDCLNINRQGKTRTPSAVTAHANISSRRD